MRSILITASAFALMSCGGGGVSALVDACVEDGESKKDCTCMAEKLEESVSPKAFEAIVLDAQGREEAANAAMKELGMADAMAVAGAMFKVATECGVAGFGD